MAAFTGDATAGLGRDRAEGGADRLDHRFEGHDGVGGGAAPQHDGALFVDLVGKAGREARLPCAGFSDEEGEVALSGLGAIPDVPQLGQVSLAADEVA